MAVDITTRPRLGARPLALPRAGAGVALCAITALAAVLRFANFALVPSNSFYDAAVRSMGLSWHNFFYGAFEPGAQVSIDKTPVDLWLQVASTKLFGFSSVAVRLPEALAAVAAVPLLYALVRRLFGRRAGLGAAAALAVLPISVVTGHSDTMDSLMMLLDVLAAWLVVVGAQRRNAWFVVAAGAVMGLAFNVKVFEGLIVLPALGVLAWLAFDLRGLRRVRALAAGLGAFVAVSLSWVTAASLAPGATPRSTTRSCTTTTSRRARAGAAASWGSATSPATWRVGRCRPSPSCRPTSATTPTTATSPPATASSRASSRSSCASWARAASSS
jgi:4-amino-4-deoxy-L-arabinose transferase-like glycosyltransferase